MFVGRKYHMYWRSDILHNIIYAYKNQCMYYLKNNQFHSILK